MKIADVYKDCGVLLSERSHSLVPKGWPKEALVQFKEIVDRYGSPDELSSSVAIWWNNGVWA